MKALHDLPTPALLLDVDRLEANLRWMADRAGSLGVSLRPHIKTHKCVEVAQRQRALGAAGITVSTLYEARVFADHGFDDITWAFPVILSRIPDAVELAGRVRLQVVADSQEAVDALSRTGEPLHVMLKVDCGYHRAGVDPEGDEVLALAGAVANSASLQLAGILSHSGHAYGVASAEGAAAVAEEERSVMVRCAERLRREGIDVPTVSVGSTPSMRAVADLSAIQQVLNLVVVLLVAEQHTHDRVAVAGGHDVLDRLGDPVSTARAGNQYADTGRGLGGGPGCIRLAELSHENR